MLCSLRHWCPRKQEPVGTGRAPHSLASHPTSSQRHTGVDIRVMPQVVKSVLDTAGFCNTKAAPALQDVSCGPLTSGFCTS